MTLYYLYKKVKHGFNSLIYWLKDRLMSLYQELNSELYHTAVVAGILGIIEGIALINSYIFNYYIL